MNNPEIEARLKRDEKVLIFTMIALALFFVAGSLCAKDQNAAAAIIFFLLLALSHLYLGYTLLSLIRYIESYEPGTVSATGPEEFPEVPSGVPLVSSSYVSDAEKPAVEKTEDESTGKKTVSESTDDAAPKSTEPVKSPDTPESSLLPIQKKELHPLFKKGLLEEFDLYNLCGKLCKERDPAYPFGPVIEFRSDKPNLTVYSDKSAFELIFKNALDNERKFLTRENKVEVTMSVIEDSQVLIIFRDNGTATTEVNPEILFNLNYQGRNKQGGSGLGLSQVKAVAEEWGGSVWIKASPKNGFALYVQMPFNQR